MWSEHKNKGKTINARRSYDSTLRNLREELKEKRRDKLAAGVLLLYDNAPVHTVRVSKAAVRDCGCEELKAVAVV